MRGVADRLSGKQKIQKNSTAQEGKYHGLLHPRREVFRRANCCYAFAMADFCSPTLRMALPTATIFVNIGAAPLTGTPATTESVVTSSRFLGMNMDVGTISGVLGIVLTVVFFIIGYRQTIGAKNERVATANKEIVETIFRRLTLDESFAMKPEAIQQYIAGKALDARVPPEALLGFESLEAALCARIIESEYIANESRQGVLDRLRQCFKVNPALALAPPTKSGWRLGSEALLGVVSAVMAAATGVFVSLPSFDLSNAPSGAERLPTVALYVFVAFAAVTALALVLYTRLRDSSTNVVPSEALVARRRAMEFEARFLRELLKLDGTAQIVREPGADVVCADRAGRAAVEARYNVNTLPLVMLRAMITRLEGAMNRHGCAKGYVVSHVPPADHIRSISDDRVTFASADDFLKQLRGVATPHRPPAA